MPSLIRCSGCAQQLSVPDHLVGSQVVCPKCKAVVDVQPPTPDQPAENADRVHPITWMMVGVGFTAAVAVLVAIFLVGSDKSEPRHAAQPVRVAVANEPHKSKASFAFEPTESAAKVTDSVNSAPQVTRPSPPRKLPSPPIPQVTEPTEKVTEPVNSVPQVTEQPGSAEPAANSADRSAENLYAEASPAVVTITIKNDNGDNFSSGSGFFLPDSWVMGQYEDYEVTRRVAEYFGDGEPQQSAYILTNYHVIKAAVDANIALLDKTRGRVIHVLTEDEESDLALLIVFVSTSKPLARLPLSDNTPRVGAAVYAIGSPHGLANSLSEGIISGIRDTKPGVPWLQTTAPISPGSSGGPLLTLDGRVVGITTSARRDGQNLNFAVPVSQIRRFLKEPFRPRELWRGTSIHREISSAYGNLRTASIIKGQGAKEDLIEQAGSKLDHKDYEAAIRLATEAKQSIPSDFRYLCYVTLGSAHQELA